MDSMIERLLDDIVVFVNETKENLKSERMKEYISNLEDDYVCLEQHKIDYFDIFDEIFEDDTPMYLLVISVLFFISQDGKMLNKTEELLQKGNLPYDLFAGVYLQLGGYRFDHSELTVSYEQNRKMHQIYLKQFEQALGIGAEYNLPGVIPYGERNHKRILIITDALLNDLHAPTHIVLEFCRILQDKLGYEVFLLVTVNKINMELVSSYWLFPYDIRYDEQYNGNFVRNFQGSLIRGHQIFVEDNMMPQIRQMLDEIRKWKPECAWSIGGSSIVSEIIGKMTTLLSMPCTEGYAVSEAPVLISCGLEDTPTAASRQNFIDGMGQNRIDIKIAQKFIAGNRKYTPQDFGVAEDAFLIAVVGNRLSIEIDYQFIQLMEEIARREEKVYYLFIGFCDLGWEQAVLKGRVFNLGFRSDLNDVLKACHLFLNPIRIGGGGAALRALSMGVPVITLPSGDVATNVGEAFICDDLEKIPTLVSRYCHDKAFYRQQVKEAERRSSEFAAEDNTANCKMIMETVQGWMLEGIC